jgi:hypothetical protein
MAKRTLVAVLVPLVLAGCGGGGHRRPVPTKAEFAAAVDAICAHATTRTGRLARLQGLRAPSGMEDLYVHWLNAEQDALDAIKPRKRPPKSHEPDPAVELAIAQGKIAGYARRLGADGCATGATGTLPP